MKMIVLVVIVAILYFVYRILTQTPPAKPEPKHQPQTCSEFRADRRRYV